MLGTVTLQTPQVRNSLTLPIKNDFQISAPPSPTHYAPRGNGDILDIAIHHNVRLSGITMSDVLDSDHLPIFFNILNQVCAGDNSVWVETHTDWDLFRSLASDLIHPRFQVDTVQEAEREASVFTASVASAYRLATHKLALSDLNNAPSGLDHFLQLKQRLRKLWHKTRNPTCKTALKWVTKTIRKMVRRNGIAVWPLVKSRQRGEKPKAPSAIHSPTGLKFLSL